MYHHDFKQMMRRKKTWLAISMIVVMIIAVSVVIWLAGQKHLVPTEPADAMTSQSSPTTQNQAHLSSEQLLDRIFRGFSFLEADQATQYYEKIPIEQRDGLSTDEMTAFFWLMKGSLSVQGKLTSENTKIGISKMDRQDLLDAEKMIDPDNHYNYFNWAHDLFMADDDGILLYWISNVSNSIGHFYFSFPFFLIKDRECPTLPGDYIRGILKLDEKVAQLEDAFRSGDAAILQPYVELGGISQLCPDAGSAIYARKAGIILNIYEKYIKPKGQNHLVVCYEYYHNPDWDVAQGLTSVYNLPVAVEWRGDIDQYLNGDDINEEILPFQIYVHIDPRGQLKLRQASFDILMTQNANLPQVRSVTSRKNGKSLVMGETYTEKDLETFFGLDHLHIGTEDHEYEGPSKAFRYGNNTVVLSGDHSILDKGFSGIIIDMFMYGDDYVLGDQADRIYTPIDFLNAWPLLEDDMSFYRETGESDAPGSTMASIGYIDYQCKTYITISFHDHEIERFSISGLDSAGD
jgi:hypothetical protein